MTISFHKAPAGADAAFHQWRRLTCIVRKAEALIAVAISRIERADRLRAASPGVVIGKSAGLLVKAVEGERDGHAALAVIPEFLEAAKADLENARDLLDKELRRE